jgi:hypothetical protein
MAHWKACGILTQFLPTFSRFAYTLPDDAEMFMCGVLIDAHSQRWKAYLRDLLAFPQQLIELAQQTIKDTVDAIIQENNPPPSAKRAFWGVEYFQRIKVLLQNMMFLNRDNIREWLTTAMQKVISGPADFQAAKVAILTLVSMNERARSLAYGEGERDLLIEYCEVQLDEIKRATFPSSELKFRLNSPFFDIHREVSRYHRIIGFTSLFNMLESVFAVGLDVQLRYDIPADQHGQLRWDLADDRLRRREISVGELHEAAGPPDPYLMLSLQDEIRKRKSELVLMESELASMEDRSTYPKDAAHRIQDRRVCMLMSGRPVRVGTTRPLPRKALQPTLLGELSFDSQKVINTFLPLGIREANEKYYTQYGKYWWNEDKRHCSGILQTLPTQDLAEHIERQDMCVEQEQDAQSVSTGVAGISSQAAMQEMEESHSTSSTENQDTLVSDLADTIAVQLTSLEAIQAEGTATHDSAVLTPQISRNLAAEMDSDCAHLHDGVRDHPKSLQAKSLERHSLRDVSNVLKTSRQQLDPASPLARGRISFKIQPRSPAMGMYQPTWFTGAAALWRSVSTDGGRPREN